MSADPDGGSFSYVYLLESVARPEKHYVGRSRDLAARLALHNQGKVRATASFAPWVISVAVAFREDAKACAFEAYLKSHSGRAFAKRHF